MLKASLSRHVNQELVPALQMSLARAMPVCELGVKVSEDAEKLWLYYPSAVENNDGYVRPSILIEFGGRNAALASHEVGRQAVGDLRLLRDVLSIKTTFFRSGSSHYERCLAGGMRLIPPPALLGALRRDYQSMLDARMFYGDTLTFDQVIDRLAMLEQRINQTE